MVYELKDGDMISKKLFLTILFCLITSVCFAQTKISTFTKDTGKQVYRCTLGEENDEVVIGDTSVSSTFKPQITFTKWNKENSLTIKPLFDIPNATTSLIGNKIEYKGGKIGWYANPDGENMKFGIILYEKPTTNTWSFQLEGWEEFDFWYQKPLANLNQEDLSSWEFDPDGSKINRLPSFSFSYAVYHKTKKNHVLGLTNYKTGLVGFFLLPKFIDADGKLVWAEKLEIKDGIYTIVVPQKFLDEAKYPIKVNDTFGYSTTGGATAHDTTLAISYQAIPASSGAVTKITVYRGQSGNTLAAIYNDNGSNAPGTLLSDVGYAYGGGWVWFDITISANIVGSTKYWLCMDGDAEGGLKALYNDTGVSKSGSWNPTYGTTTSFIDPHPGFTATYTRDYCIYATYTPSGGAAAPKMQVIWIN